MAEINVGRVILDATLAQANLVGTIKVLEEEVGRLQRENAELRGTKVASSLNGQAAQIAAAKES